MDLTALKKLVNRFPALIAFALITGSLLLFYANSFQAEWHYDDFHHIKENINIRKVDNLDDFFTDPTTFSRNPNTRMYRPLLLSTFAINYALGFYNQFGYHVVNFVFHLLTTFLVFLIARFLFARRVVIPGLNPFIPGLFAALLFGLHTINTETVVYVSSRSAGMSTMFVLAAFYAYLKGTQEGKVRWLLLVLGAVSYALALLTKEIAITLPAMLLFYELLLNRLWWGGRTPIQVALGGFLRLLPFGITALAYIGVRKVVLSEASLTAQVLQLGGNAAAPSFESQIATQLRVWVYYLRETLWPTSLSIDKPFEVTIVFFNDPRAIGSLLFILALLGLALAVWKRYPLITFSALWFFTALLPESLFRLNVILNDHRLYLPGLGAVLVFTLLASRLYVRFREENGWRLPVFLTVAALTLLFMGLGTFKRNMAFATEETIWKDVILKDRQSVRGYNNLGIYYEGVGQLDKAIKFYQRTAQLAPLFPNPYINLGNVYHKKKDFERAVQNMRHAIKLEPDSALAWYNLGNILREANRSDEAIDAYENTLRFNPRYIEAANNVANIYYQRQDFAKAVIYYQRALQIDPTFAMSYYNLALAQESLGQWDEAARGFADFLRFWDGDPKYGQIAREKLAMIRSRPGQGKR